MPVNLDVFQNKKLDLIIIGGGINGCALANVASLNGLSCALFEKGDFASGTSSKSTKLLHGGLRYLENFEFGLVRESLRERYIQYQSAPHLIKPMEFILPIYQKDHRPFWKMKLGVQIYHFLSGQYSFGKPTSLNKEQTLTKIKGISAEGLKGSVTYFDAQMDDARLCIENALQGREQGAYVSNYTEVRKFIFENEKAVGVEVYDSLSKQTQSVYANHIISTAGSWTNQILKLEDKKDYQPVRPTKGVHIVVPQFFSNHPLLLQNNDDGRIFFIIPWFGASLIGTTDTDYSGHPDDVDVSPDDVEYLIGQTNQMFPDVQLTWQDVVYSFAGLRPLVSQSGNPSQISRNHVIEETDFGVIYVMGGKYTTYRVIAEEALKKIMSKPIKDTSQYYPLYGGGTIEQSLEDLMNFYELDQDVVENLIQTYGTKATDVMVLAKTDPQLSQRISQNRPHIQAQIIYAQQTEMAVTEEDVAHRRLSFFF